MDYVCNSFVNRCMDKLLVCYVTFGYRAEKKVINTTLELGQVLHYLHMAPGQIHCMFAHELPYNCSDMYTYREENIDSVINHVAQNQRARVTLTANLRGWIPDLALIQTF